MLALAPGCASLCAAAGHGFEMPLVAAFATLAFVECIRSRRTLRPVLIGVWIGLAFWTRMDALIPGWPLSNRLAHGWFQNRSTALALCCGLLPLLWLGLTRLERYDRPLLLALAAAPLCVAYSTSNGGDFIGPSFGYDRFASAGTALLVLGVAAVALKARLESWHAPLFLIGLHVEPGPVFGYAYNAVATQRCSIHDRRARPNASSPPAS